MGRVLVLGARSGIARAVAAEFARNGHGLYLAARGHEGLREEAARLSEEFGVKADALEFDATAYKSHGKFYDSLADAPEGVVCAVGYLGDQGRAQDYFAEAERIIDTNYKGCVSILNVAASHMQNRGSGFIIAIGSPAGDRGRKSNYIYGSAKAGLDAYLSGLRNRLFDSGVHVMTVKPGFVNTGMTRDMNLPAALTSAPERVARDIFRGCRSGKDCLYTAWYWRFIMLAIRHIPEGVFKRMNL